MAEQSRAMPEVKTARAWASGDLARVALVRARVASLNRRLYAAGADALDAPPFATPQQAPRLAGPSVVVPSLR